MSAVDGVLIERACVFVDHDERALARSSVERAGAIDALTETRHAGPLVERPRFGLACAALRNRTEQGVGADVERGGAESAHARERATAPSCSDSAFPRRSDRKSYV